MAIPDPQQPDLDEEEENEEEDLLEEEEEEETEDTNTFTRHHRGKPPTQEEIAREKLKMENLLQRIQEGPVPLRVHDVIIKGNKKTKDYLIEAEAEALKSATTVQELLQTCTAVNMRLQLLDVFDSATVTLEAGPPELPGTTNVVIEVVEAANPLSGEIGAYTKAEGRSYTVEGSLKYKNPFGYGDIWDGSVKYGCDHSAELSAGVTLPRFKGLVTPLSARVYLLSQDWIKFSSYKERSLGMSLGLFSNDHHDLSYGLAWRNLSDPSQTSSRSVRRQLGHNLLSSLKYTFKVDRRNSPLRPTRGHSFVSTTQVGGLSPDSRSLRFFRQEYDFRYAIPLGFYRAALNVGASAGLIVPLGNGLLSESSSIPERFFLGGNSSPLCALGGPTSLWGFKTRGLGLTEPRRHSNDENADPPERDNLGGDLAVSAFADLSFDLPLSWLREKGIHGHVFANAGNVAQLSENQYMNFSPQKFIDSFRTSVGAGLVIPTSLFRMEVNYCHIVKKDEHDRAKSGFWLTFSAPS